jgi:hypothetical protein
VLLLLRTSVILSHAPASSASSCDTRIRLPPLLAAHAQGRQRTDSRDSAEFVNSKHSKFVNSTHEDKSAGAVATDEALTNLTQPAWLA